MNPSYRAGLFRFGIILIIFPLMSALSTCKSSDIWKTAKAAVTAKQMTSFGIATPASAGVIDETSKAVSVTVPYGTSLTSLVATFSFTGAKASVGGIEQKSGTTANDFSSPVIYTVTAADDSSCNYTVTVTVASSSAKDITSFSIGGKSATIWNSTISLVLPYGTALTSLSPVITHTGVSISPASGTAQDFTNPVTYTVTAVDNSTKLYTVTVTAAKSDSKDISSFTILGNEGVISGTDITVTVPYGTDVTALQPTVVFSGSSVSPASGTTLNFTNPVTYTVTAADSSTKSYQVTVVVALNSSKDIISFTILGVDGVIAGTSISLTVPYGTDVTSLSPVITQSGASITPASGKPMNFTTSVIYTVTAADSSISQYTVTVTAAPSNSKDITLFDINGTAGTVSGTAISVTLPYGTPVTSLAPSITHTGSAVSPASGTYQDFTNPVAYTVTAADTSTKTYTVTIIIAANSAKDITFFAILGVNGIFSGTDISVVLPYGTNVSSLSAACTFTGVSVSPSPFTPHDYSSAFAYTVTAADSSTKTYTVTVTVAAKINVTGLSISPSSPVVSVKNYTQILAVFTPSNASIQTVTWATSDSSIASVSVSGLVYGKKSGFGDVTITCTSTDNTLISASITITVLPLSGSSVTVSGSGLGSSETYNLTSGESVAFIQTSPDTVSASSPIVFPTTLADSGTGSISKPVMIGETEVTYEAWQTVYTWATSNGYTIANAGVKGSPGSGNSEQPVTNVSWRDAIVWCNAFTEYYNAKNGSYPDLVCAYYSNPAYATVLRSTSDSMIDTPYVYYSSSGNTDNALCTASGIRLPSVSEWEYAARYIGTTAPSAGNLAAEFISQGYNGGSSSLTSGYFWTPGDYAAGATADYSNASATGLTSWYSTNASTTQKVKQKTPNALHLYDMSGNVREWCFEIAFSTYRADRGGSFYNDETYLKIGRDDNGNAPNFISNIYGFRVAKNK
jgi:formylglycine-generating enzyme required for sulfatase activity